MKKQDEFVQSQKLDVKSQKIKADNKTKNTMRPTDELNQINLLRKLCTIDSICCGCVVLFSSI